MTDANAVDRTYNRDLPWCIQKVEEQLGSPCSVLQVTRIPARIAVVHRLSVKAGGTHRQLYLKRYPATNFDLSGHFADLSTISSAFVGANGLLPYRLVAADPELRLLLMAETMGKPLARIHRKLLDPRYQRLALRVWGEVGSWLAVLHHATIRTIASATHPQELKEYTLVRLQHWAQEDQVWWPLARRAEEAVAIATAALSGRPVVLTPSHGDISVGNIVVGRGTGLVDFDDFRFDMPALDLSQALLEIESFSRLAQLVQFRSLRDQARRRFLAGYGQPLPPGPEFWLPHLRNLAVFVLTLARQRKRASPASIFNYMRYRRTIRELEQSVSLILSSAGTADYLRSP